ncbi:MAG: hypothetical protein PVH22_13705, partial [Desulfobacteraceae bacterium]
GDPAGLCTELGGHLRAIGTVSYPDHRSIYQWVDNDPFFDRQVELRLKHQLFMGTHWTLSTHYELAGQQGDTIQNNNRLRAIWPAGTVVQLVGGETMGDDRRLMNLTHTISDGEDDVVYHRLDRLNLTYAWERGTIGLGRQALTWGNGLIFNPMDLFNPFAPTTVQRDYKLGDDMLLFQFTKGDSEAQLLYLPRRDTVTGKIEDDQSSYAGKWHLAVGTIEVDMMAATHFSDLIFGVGASGYKGGAAWRSDLIYTLMDSGCDRNDFFQLVANIDYAWQWGGKNIYGLLEFFYNGLGEDQNYARALSDPDISQRVERGELFTLGRTYIGGRLSVELHPLVQAGITAIINISDPSAIVQPQLMWDIAPNFQLIIGANLNGGDEETEFGGFNVDTEAGTIKAAPTDSRYLWLTYYF